ncbi:hypothetical protein [Aestuariivirga litoralis]|uniref:hypothetical protein n=1 Tax=Aestuariivirga litoralis TaxID=2650924 RepID=UPI0018C5FF62|nr:hypothetical protein [Aestuariivirga litoralis]MBG1232997.1 hypothetical protein [Aestuariivirga litoralis]
MLPPTKAERKSRRGALGYLQIAIRVGIVGAGVFWFTQWQVKPHGPASTMIAKTEPAGASVSTNVVASNTQVQACTPDQFQISGVKYTIYDACEASSCPILKIVGQVINQCTEPFGVQMRVTAYDKAGGIVDTSEAWPFSVRNIPPSRSTPFNLDTIFPYQKSMAKFSMEAVQVEQWR